MGDLFEGLMLTAFSVSWYCSIWKMLASGRVDGKSLGFVLLICAGYVCGICAKAIFFMSSGELSPLIYLYVWNLGVTSFDAYLVYRLGRKEQALAVAAPTQS